MKYSAVLLASAGAASALTQTCSGTAKDEGGNWFCGMVNHILYEGIGGSGNFKNVVSMGSNGDCQTEDKAYGGPLAPLDEDLSIHLRGPIHLREAAVYNLASSSKREEAPAHAHARRHGHNHGHLHQAAKKDDMVVATIDGQVVSWVNDYFGGGGAPAAPTDVPAPSGDAPPATDSKPKGSSGNKGKGKGKSKAVNAAGKDWTRVAYYNAKDQVVDNMVFLGNYGGEGSGVFDTTWGNSLSFLNADGTGGSATSQILKDTTLGSNQEFAIFSGEKCDDSCGYSRAPDVAYKGFEGANKIFLFDFKMPLDGSRDFNGDMPALWALNAKIPRTAQYSECSCWTTGCGECDIFEVLASGDTKCKSTFHLANGAGSSDYFDRPVDKYVKVATVFDAASSSVSIRELPEGTTFAEGLDAETVVGWINGEGESNFSLFQLLG